MRMNSWILMKNMIGENINMQNLIQIRMLQNSGEKQNKNMLKKNESI